MAKNPSKQIMLAQNFLRSPERVRKLLQASSIQAADIVYEIGPGRGIITAQLAHLARRVIAIEKDPVLASRLRQRFRNASHVAILTTDFLRYQIPDRSYKIFASIPYNVTADIVRKILYAPPVPQEAYLVMQKEAAERFSGRPRETQFSILAKPLFRFQILRELRRTDFEPVPGVDSVLLQIQKRHPPLVQPEEATLYRSFVRYGFGRWKMSLKQAFKPVFTYEQWKRLSRELCFPIDATPTGLTFEQWLGLFKCLKQRVPVNKQACVTR